MVLSDRSIREAIKAGDIVIRPLSESCIQPASVDVHLGKKVMVFQPWEFPHWIDLQRPLDGLTKEVEIPEGRYFSLQPGQFVLASLEEYVEISDSLMARLEGKSSLGRIGLLIHATAGYVDPGWRGHLTLELYNVAPLPILLYPGMKISQISFHLLTTRAENPYGSRKLGSKYQGQTGPTPTRFYQEFAQSPLVNLPELPSVPRPASTRASALKEWLASSEFSGNVRRFADALGAPAKTVEDWVYRGVQPSRRYWARLFAVTQLPQFRVSDSWSQEALGPSSDT